MGGKFGKSGVYDGEFAFIDPVDFPKVAREFPGPEWEVRRRVDGHYKISHSSQPFVTYKSIGKARSFKESLDGDK